MCWFWVKTRDLKGSVSFSRIYFSHPFNGIRPMLILSLNNFYKCVIQHGVLFSLLIINLLIYTCCEGAVVVLIAQQLDLQLPMQSVPITTNGVRSNPTQAIQHYVIKFSVTCDRLMILFAVSSINKIDRHDIAGILLKVA